MIWGGRKSYWVCLSFFLLKSLSVQDYYPLFRTLGYPATGLKDGMNSSLAVILLVCLLTGYFYLSALIPLSLIYLNSKGKTMRYATPPFHPSSMQSAAAANNSAAAKAYIRGMQATLARELDSHHINYGCHRYKRKVFGLDMVTTWCYKVQIYKPYLLVVIPTMLNLRHKR